MRILLDECVPVRLARHLPGHTIQSVKRRAWNGLSDGQLLARAVGDFDVFLTVDQSIEYQQVVPQSMILVTIASRSIEYIVLRELAPEILRRLETARLGEAIRITAQH